MYPFDLGPYSCSESRTLIISSGQRTRATPISHAIDVMMLPVLTGSPVPYCLLRKTNCLKNAVATYVISEMRKENANPGARAILNGLLRSARLKRSRWAVKGLKCKSAESRATALVMRTRRGKVAR